MLGAEGRREAQAGQCGLESLTENLLGLVEVGNELRVQQTFHELSSREFPNLFFGPFVTEPQTPTISHWPPSSHILPLHSSPRYPTLRLRPPHFHRPTFTLPSPTGYRLRPCLRPVGTRRTWAAIVTAVAKSRDTQIASEAWGRTWAALRKEKV
ncbi:uncharacterized protein MYCGRDRAFT_106641 [Zymoseptoria tritici IPO323]|uniref:Uncharacterized protein n=1 Tax=Zymoseptoria tritici (strain CBS 115943 / IPO323) TaxID=336722 RepID=F9XRG5_ZYMTI|nr:uncharacterized protein MYCGRDRAFT_106641 [Zymoseptoria tritici IPO323]EGP82170.1 hypothetical protein MYCGRDRAFT_106641 [Zymoseptoria tritici IPO323]